jgi:hypothetical protein
MQTVIWSKTLVIRKKENSIDMKNIAFLIILLTGIMLVDACKKAETDPQLNMNSAVSPSITAPAEGSEIMLTEETASETVTFSWNAAQYNLSDLASTQYLLQIVVADSSFDIAKKIATTTATSFSITQAELNSTLITMGLTPDVAANMKFRVRASLNSYDDGATIAETELISDPVTAMITPYQSEAPPEYPKLWVPGAYQGWAPDVAPVIQSFEDDGIYTGYVYFPEDSESFYFKFTSEPSWDGTNYGAGDTEGTLSDTGGDILLPGPGGYRLTVNLNDLTWTYELQTWGIIGEFNGWAEQWNLEWDNVNNYLTITTDIPAAENNRFKFRANDDWDMAMGDLDPSDGKTLTSPGVDIPITDGNKTINLILSGPKPQYQIIEN